MDPIKKNKFEDLHDGDNNMILNASSPNGEVTLITPSQYCLKLFSKTTVGKANKFIFESLESLGCLEEIMTRTVTSLLSIQYSLVIQRGIYWLCHLLSC